MCSFQFSEKRINANFSITTVICCWNVNEPQLNIPQINQPPDPCPLMLLETIYQTVITNCTNKKCTTIFIVHILFDSVFKREKNDQKIYSELQWKCQCLIRYKIQNKHILKCLFTCLPFACLCVMCGVCAHWTID